jgi:hypothetical protein
VVSPRTDVHLPPRPGFMGISNGEPTDKESVLFIRWEGQFILHRAGKGGASSLSPWARRICCGGIVGGGGAAGGGGVVWVGVVLVVLVVVVLVGVGVVCRLHLPSSFMPNPA